MANATETTKYAAVWNPPRLTILYATATSSGSHMRQQYWEGGTSNPVAPARNQNGNYRMPTSGDVGHNFHF